MHARMHERTHARTHARTYLISGNFDLRIALECHLCVLLRPCVLLGEHHKQLGLVQQQF